MKVLAILIIVIGVLIAGLSGLCTLTFTLGSLGQMFSRNPTGSLPVLLMALVIGGPFIAGGVALLRLGLGLWDRRSGKRGRGGPA